MRKKFVFLFFTLIHLACSFGLFVFSFSFGMRRIETGEEATAFIQILDSISTVLLFPGMQFATLAPSGMFSGLWGYIPITLNSFLWAGIVMYVYYKIFNRVA